MKRFLRIFLALIVLGGIAWGGLWLYEKNKKTEFVTEPEVGIKIIVNDPVVSPTSSLDRNSIWFFNPATHLFRTDFDGNNLTEYPLPALSQDKKLTRVLWSQAGSDFIAVSGSEPNDTKNYFESASGKYFPLPVNVEKIDWLPDGKRVAYIWQATDKKSQQLVIANPDTSGFRIVSQVQWPDLAIKVSPDGKLALLWRTRIEGNTNSIYLADLQTGTIQTVVEDGKNFAANWLNGDKFMFSRLSEQAFPRLFSYSLSSRAEKDLNLNTTLERTVLTDEGHLMFAAISKSDSSGDYFVKVDLSSLKQEIYFEPAEETRIKEIFYLGNTLCFINAKDGKLYSVSK